MRGRCVLFVRLGWIRPSHHRRLGSRDSLVPAPSPSSSRCPKLNLTLVGTIIDSKGRLAIITDPSGKFDIKAAGEALELSPEGVTITKIASDQVTLSYQGKPWEVTLDRTATSPVPQDAADQPRKRSGGRRRR